MEGGQEDKFSQLQATMIEMIQTSVIPWRLQVNGLVLHKKLVKCGGVDEWSARCLGSRKVLPNIVLLKEECAM